jgi:hypothetical protein
LFMFSFFRVHVGMNKMFNILGIGCCVAGGTRCYKVSFGELRNGVHSQGSRGFACLKFRDNKY